MIKLNTKSMILLTKCLEVRNPSLLFLIESSEDKNHTVEFYNELRQAVGEELAEKGFRHNWEPNEYGLELESLIDELGRLFMPH